MWLCEWFVGFVVYSCLGWIYETIYCMIKWKKWENRGFLYGPVCPIYGIGVVSVMGLTELANYLSLDYKWWQVFLVCAIGSMFLEYSVHWALEKIFHAVWWDYSYMPLNINGRCCVPYAVLFGFAGMLVAYVLTPFTEKAASHIPDGIFELVALIFAMVIGMDMALTASAISNFEIYVADADHALDTHMEQFVTEFGEKYGQMSETMASKVAEEKEKFSREHMYESFSKMSTISKAAVKRIISYRPKNGKQYLTHNRLAEFMRNHKQDSVPKKS